MCCPKIIVAYLDPNLGYVELEGGQLTIGSIIRAISYTDLDSQ